VRHSKRANIMACIGLLTGALALTSCSGPGGKPAEEAAPAAMSEEQRVERGRYLVLVMGCGDCHTPGTFAGAPDRSRWLAGSEYGWQGPWGTSYASNLTPDSTGLPGWTEEDFVRVLKSGTRKDGTKVLPPMPWPWFSNLTDEDAGAIGAYLTTLAPVPHVVPKRTAPGQKAPGAVIVFPPPQPWDMPAQQAQ